MTWTEKALNVRPYIEKAATSLADADALKVPTMFPKWEAGIAYVADDRIEYNGTLYRVVQSHTSQADWTPNVTPALWTTISLDEYPQWVQPTGSHDVYKVGDKVTYNEQKWVSIVDNNVWQPGVYGWEAEREE